MCTTRRIRRNKPKPLNGRDRAPAEAANEVSLAVSEKNNLKSQNLKSQKKTPGQKTGGNSR